jgi:TrpR family trp operon transcriptional repressor
MKEIDSIVKIMSNMSEKELKEFLIGILTDHELDQIVTRSEIIKLLKQNVPQHKIANKLGVGVATVSRGSKMLSEGKFKNIWG